MKRGAIGRAELDRMGCETPNCTHDHSLLYMSPFCHPQAGCLAIYDKKDGILILQCSTCEMPVGAFQIGETEIVH